METIFVCPDCKGTRWRTIQSIDHQHELGECSGCGFQWIRSEDHLVMVYPVGMEQFHKIGALVKEAKGMVGDLEAIDGKFFAETQKAWSAVRGRLVIMILSREERAGMEWLDKQFGEE